MSILLIIHILLFYFVTTSLMMRSRCWSSWKPLPLRRPVSEQIQALRRFWAFQTWKKNNSWTDLFFHFLSVIPGIVPIIAKIHFQKQTDEQNWVSWKRKEQNTGTGCLLFLLSSSSFLRPFEERSECKAVKQEQRCKTRDGDCMLVWEGSSYSLLVVIPLLAHIVSNIINIEIIEQEK